jgi:GT2 family glycosyltransferase
MVVLITLNYNQNNFTTKCIESILASDYKDFKILLVDNGSTSENYSKLGENLPVDDRLILYRVEKNKGYVGGINYGLIRGAELNPDYFLILNNDTILDKNAINELKYTCEKYKNKAIVSGKVYHYDEPNKLQDVGYTYKNKEALYFNRIGLNEEDNDQYDQIAERDMLDDVFWLFSAELYNKIGGYSPYFWFNAEQADFALRAKKEGYKLIYTPQAKLWHKGSVSIGGRERNPKLIYWHIQSTLIFRYIHLSKYQFFIQYFKIVKEIIASYLKTILDKIRGKGFDFNYPKAKLKGLNYFNKWIFLRNENTGFDPFKNS